MMQTTNQNWDLPIKLKKMIEFEFYNLSIIISQVISPKMYICVIIELFENLIMDTNILNVGSLFILKHYLWTVNGQLQ